MPFLNSENHLFIPFPPRLLSKSAAVSDFSSGATSGSESGVALAASLTMAVGSNSAAVLVVVVGRRMRRR